MEEATYDKVTKLLNTICIRKPNPKAQTIPNFKNNQVQGDHFIELQVIVYVHAKHYAKICFDPEK